MDSPSEISIAKTKGFFQTMGLFRSIPEATEKKDFYSYLIRSLLKVERIERGRVICTLSVTSTVTNPYNTLHGGVVAAVAEEIGLACAKSVVGDKQFFLGEFSTAYLVAARIDAKIEVEGRILRQGRSVIVTSIEFRLEESKKLAYISRATYYIMPVANL
ncbi:hypothetical protein HPP92_025343 [Vanilla planifolia]|uniref:Thioesterase domain-containing protein n=1 Tax=Vanilla planifolia TaxID=51239 RepID=A0A835PIW4_VANPL|nr:hypothetical protein HPP92_025343 [Vanilla planifolia]